MFHSWCNLLYIFFLNNVFIVDKIIIWDFYNIGYFPNCGLIHYKYFEMNSIDLFLVIYIFLSKKTKKLLNLICFRCNYLVFFNVISCLVVAFYSLLLMFKFTLLLMLIMILFYFFHSFFSFQTIWTSLVIPLFPT